jgi:Fe-S-cluster-containing hydrogenase component 2
VRAGTSDLALTYLRKGDYGGQAALLLEEAWPFSLQALEHVEIVKIGREQFHELLTRYPQLQDELWRETLARLKVRGSVARNPTSSEYIQMAMETGLIHGESVLLIDLATCTRCDECVRGCADAHDGQPRFIREGQKYRNWLVPTACYQCTDPVCMMDCPTGAISREVGTLEVTINEPTCIGCGNCAERCPWGNIVMVETQESRPDGKPVELATKCDLCLARPEGPACVQMCPHGSSMRISFKDMQRVAATLR